MRIAYADPPYPGQGVKRYKAGKEVNHRVLIDTLMDQADRWALSTSSSALRDLLPMCPPKTRVAAWCKPFASAVCLPFYAWEPVLLYGVNRKIIGEAEKRGHDWLVCGNVQRRGGKSVGFTPGGDKPQAFCFWLFDMLGLGPRDTFWDVFPGSGAVTRCWREYVGQPHISEEAHMPLFGGEIPR